MPRFNDPTTELSYLEKDDVIMTGSPSQFANIKAQNVFVRSLTYAQLEALVTASTLIIGQEYLITNATTANFNLIVSAVTVNQIGCEAKDPLYPNDIVKYNFASNVITWRWDTVNDISAGEDWRNSNNIQIGAVGCSKITIGAGCTNISIGDNCTNIEISESCTNITIPNNCEKIKIRYSSNIVGLGDFGGSGNVEIDTCSALEFDCQVQANKIFSVNSVDFASGSQIEAVSSSQIYGQSSGVCRGIYFSGGVLTTYNPAQV